MRRMIGLAAAVLFASVLVAPGASASGTSISLRVKPRIVDFTKATKLSGSLSTGRRGVPVVLEAKRFPFTGGFHQVASTTTAKQGRFTFKRKQSAATRYFVALKRRPSVRSKTRTAYADSHWSNFKCWFSPAGAPNVKYPCGHDTVPPGGGNYFLHVTFDRQYPAAAYSTESAKPVYVYYGQRNGSTNHPGTLQLKKQVSQQPAGSNATKVAYSVAVTFPNSAWSFYTTSCNKDTESVDGLGLPGHHYCGDSSITYRQATHYLG
jgi:hypothetical protein